MESAQQPARSCAGVFAVPGDFDSMDERMPVASGALHDPPAAGWKIVYDYRPLELQVSEVDHIEIGAIARGNHSAVVESISSSRCQRLLVH